MATPSPNGKGGGKRILFADNDPILNTPIIAFSALSPEQIRRFPELSADAYVAKGPLAVVANNLLMALKYLEEHGRGELDGGIFGSRVAGATPYGEPG